MQHRRQRLLMDLLFAGGLVAAISGWAMGAGTFQVVARAPGPQAPSGAGEQTSTLRGRPASRRLHKVKLVTMDFVDADLVQVIKVLAKEMGRNVYIGPGVEGLVTVSLKSVPVESALVEILKMQKNAVDYKLVGYNTLIVAGPGKCDEIQQDILGKSFVQTTPSNSVRQEILLEKAPAAKVISFLQGQYKNVEFIPHPTMNGFYAVGSREDILKIKKDIPDLDIAPVSFPPPGRRFTEVKCGDLNECKELLKKLVPDVQIKPYQGGP